MMTNSQLNRGKWKYFQSFTSSLRNVFILSLFLGIVTIYLLKSFNFNFENKSERNSRTIYDPEKPLPPSSSVLHTFKHTAISSDSEICSQIARGKCLIVIINAFEDQMFFIL
ncbi:CLUMA_CG017172, isoform A [Clunio marinus]|uniref:CLUMA_CG017172, isoform A n=1 Tax=Clunio marinus TaxID=568069 RepID=A0A1J1IUY5_9DIPT|nr:CLUMA_CG017172, isoform A [Clunio marinus]